MKSTGIGILSLLTQKRFCACSDRGDSQKCYTDLAEWSLQAWRRVFLLSLPVHLGIWLQASDSIVFTDCSV